MALGLPYAGTELPVFPPRIPAMNRSASLSAVAAGVVALAAVVAAPSTHAATDYKFVAPVDCEPYVPGGTLATELVVSPTGIYNPGTSIERVLCPMPRDQDDPFISGD